MWGLLNEYCFQSLIIVDWFLGTGGNKMKENDVERLVEYLKNIPLSKQVRAEEFGYDNPVLICIDAVLSINRPYYRFVAPRIEHFKKEYAVIIDLGGLVNLIERYGYEQFDIVWKYKHPQRVVILDSLAKKYLRYKDEVCINNDLLAMKDWAKKSSLNEFEKFGVEGIGLATFQYLRMLLGVSTFKPDVHIKKAVSIALGRKLNEMKVIELMEKASEIMGVEAIMMDHNLWRFFAEKEDE